MHIDTITLNALLGAMIIAITAAPLGCFVVWRKMAYFSDALSHSSLLGIALGLVTGLNINIGIVVICTIFAALLLWLQQKKILAADSIIVILMSTGLALGAILISFFKDANVDLEEILFGDISNITQNEIAFMAIGGVVVFATLMAIWNKLIITTISEDLAQSEGVNLFLTQLIFTALITITTAFSVKVVGVLLITSLMIIPAAAARQVSGSPKQMAIIAAIVGALAVNFGILFYGGTGAPIGPSIVLCASALFVCSVLVSGLKAKNI